MSIKMRYKLIANMISICLPVVFAVIICQISLDQVFGSESLTETASVNQSDTIKLSVRRGQISDRNGQVLADSKRVCSLFADPEIIRNKNETAAKLAEILQLDPAMVLKLFSTEKEIVRIKKALVKGELDEIARLKLTGVYTAYEYHRFYPGYKLLRHVLGMTDIDGNGIGGIEEAYDEKLKGDNVFLEIGEDGLSRQIIETNSPDIQPRDGSGIKLTIDKVVQQYVEDEIEKAFASNESQAIMAIVMNVSTGEILAMANQPVFNLYSFTRAPTMLRRNRCITDSFEPGAIMKPLIVGALFNHGIVSPEYEIDCHNGTFKMGDRVLHDSHPFGNLTVADVVVRSSHIGIAQLAAMIEKEKLYKHLTDLQFGDKFNLKLPGQSSGSLHPLSTWTNDSVTSIALGYEIMVTPLQLINAYCCIANGGELLQPTIVKAIVTGDGEKNVEEYNTPNVIRRVMSINTTRSLLNPILVDVVNEGTGRMAMLKEYQVAGKTGTALTYEGNNDSHKKYVASFVGYAPAANPEICVLVMVDEPKGKYYGGAVAAPVVGNIIERTLNYHYGLVSEP